MDSYAPAAAFSDGVEADVVVETPRESQFDDKAFIDPRRQQFGYRPLKAWHHFRELLKDKENTEEVFHIFESLPWKGVEPAARAYLASERGRQIRTSEAYLVPILDDHAALRLMPAGSVAQAYCDFMEREGLSAQGLIDEFDKFSANRPKFDDQLEWYFRRLRDTHDLLHVLTGYGRDALGEACVLAFTYSQQPAPANLFISYLAGLNMRKRGTTDAPILRAIREGQRLGKACPRIAEQSIRELLAMPLDEARAKLNITPAKFYHEVHQVWQDNGIDPFDLLTDKKAA